MNDIIKSELKEYLKDLHSEETRLTRAVNELCEAIRTCDIQTFNNLIFLGMNPNLSLLNGKASLLTLVIDVAEFSDWPKVARMLILAGASTDMRDLHGRTAIMSLVSAGEVSLLRIALDKLSTDQNMDILVIRAVHFGQLDCLKLLLQCKASPDAVDINGNSAVMWAAGRSNGIGMQRSLSCLKILINYGANVNPVNRIGHTPLMAASLISEVETVRVLLKAGSVFDATDSKGESALMKAVDADAEQVVKLLIEAGAQVNMSCNKGQTSLMRAVSLDILELLLKRGADVAKCDFEGYTALHRQIENNYWNSALTLIQYGASLEARTNEGLSSLQLSIRRKNYSCASLLLEAGTNPESCENQTSIIHEALLPRDYYSTWNIFSKLNTQEMWNDMVSYSKNYLEPTHQLLKSLISFPSCFRTVSDGVTPLMLASACGDEWTVKLLINQGCDVLILDGDDRSALSYSVRSGVLSIVKFLIYRGCPSNVVDSYGNLPIYYAAAFGHVKIVLILMVDFAFYMQHCYINTKIIC